MTDPRTYWPFVAAWSERDAHRGMTRADVVDSAIEDIEELLNSGEIEPDAVRSEPVELYLDCTLCEPGEGDEECYCGGAHDEPGWWGLAGWKSRLEISLEVDEPETPDGDFTVREAHHG